MEESPIVKAIFDETYCKQALRLWQESQGRTCKWCSNQHLRWQTTLAGWICVRCGCYTSVREGSCFEESRLPCHLWLRGAFVLSQCKSYPKAIDFQMAVGITRYASARRMLTALPPIPPMVTPELNELLRLLYFRNPTH